MKGPKYRVLFRKDKEQPWEHIVIDNGKNILSDRIEAVSLSAIDVLRELDKIGIISLQEEEI